MQSIREIVFDTETTGFDPLTGDRLVEIGAVELINHVPTGRTYHQYINPDRDVPEEVVKVHGLTNEFLKDYPLFEKVAQEWVDFVGDDGILVAHNATFDMKFINYELKRLCFDEYQWDRVIDTLEIAKSKFPGQRNNLDVLCKRFGIDNSARTFHGALLDAQLLAEVYLELLGGAEPTMDLSSSVKTKDVKSDEVVEVKRVFREARKFLFSEEENLAHREFLEKNIKNPIWLADEVEENKEAN
jgi:DNA polymerase-3 subunit epsilon